MSLVRKLYRGAEISEIIDALAKLRIEVFRDWPYLYDGDMSYERRYLADYTRSDGCVASVWDGAKMVGAATGMALSAQPQEVRSGLEAVGKSVDKIYYCAESVLLPGYRGQGLGHHFFDAREEVARSLGFLQMAFCGVVRDPQDPRRPKGARSLGRFWQGRGYSQVMGAIARMSWCDIGDDRETEKLLQFWMRSL